MDPYQYKKQLQTKKQIQKNRRNLKFTIALFIVLIILILALMLYLIFSMLKENPSSLSQLFPGSTVSESTADEIDNDGLTIDKPAVDNSTIDDLNPDDIGPDGATLEEHHPEGINPVESAPETTATSSVPNSEVAVPDLPSSQQENASNPTGGSILQETGVYTFLQGPAAWNAKTDWSGEWCKKELGGQLFSVFGCGLCCLANIYSTLTPYECSPVDMFHYAVEQTDYAPSGSMGAIDWPYLKQTLQKTGITSVLAKKDKTYEQFQAKVSKAKTVIALVCSANDSTYWQNVNGHYVNLWLYNAADDTILLGDPGNPAHNRQRIPLSYVYNALKTSGSYQYLLITAVDEEANTWKHDGISDLWNAPSYL